MDENIKLENKKFTVLGIDIWELLAYFVIYNIAGFLVETSFALIKYGVLESRQSFLYGPFCGIYGVGAVIMILFLQYFNKNWATLFAGGFIIGSITEYFMSLMGELILHVKWWDYSNMAFNLNGRICFAYSMFWGILAIFLMKVIHPYMKKLVNRLSSKMSKKSFATLALSLTIFIFVDGFVSGYAISLFRAQMIVENNLDVPNKEIIYEMNENINNSKLLTKLRKTLFTNEKLVKTYPNLKVQLVDGSNVYFKDLLPDIKPYYFKFSETDLYSK